MSDRHAFRADWHDYNGGIYFVTICTHDKKHILGHISDGKMYYSPIGQIVEDCLTALPNHHKNVELWSHVVMPNHIHMVLSVGSEPAVGAQYFAPTSSGTSSGISSASAINTGCLKPPRHGEPRSDNHFNSRLAVIVRSFKAACSIEINRRMRVKNIAATQTTMQASQRAQNIAPLRPIWQRNYHEHIIRNERAFNNIMNYIDSNVARWETDCFNNIEINN